MIETIITREELTRSMQKALAILHDEKGVDETFGAPGRGEFVVEVSPSTWQWKIRYRSPGDEPTSPPRGEWNVERGHQRGKMLEAAVYRITLEVGQPLPVSRVYEELSRQYQDKFASKGEDGLLEMEVEAIFRKLDEVRGTLNGYRWTRSDTVSSRGARLSIRVSKSTSWWALVGYRIGESRAKHETDTLAEGSLSVVAEHGQFSVVTTISPGSNLRRVKAKVLVELKVKLGQAELEAMRVKSDLSARLSTPGDSEERSSFLRVRRAIERVKAANNKPGTYFVPPWTPRQSLDVEAKPYYQTSDIWRHLHRSPELPRLPRGAILQVAWYPNRTIRAEGWVLNLTPWQSTAASLEANYMQVYASHKEGITHHPGMRFKEYLVIPDRRRTASWASEVTGDFIRTYGLSDIQRELFDGIDDEGDYRG